MYKQILKLKKKTNNSRKKWAKDLNSHISPKHIYRWQIAYEKMFHIMSSGNWKIKWDITTHPLVCPKSRMLTTPQMLVRMWSNRNSHPLLVGMKNHTAIQKAVWWFLIKLNTLYCMIQQSHSLVFTQMSWKCMSRQKPERECLCQLYSQLSKLGRN